MNIGLAITNLFRKKKLRMFRLRNGTIITHDGKLKSYCEYGRKYPAWYTVRRDPTGRFPKNWKICLLLSSPWEPERMPTGGDLGAGYDMIKKL